MTGAPTDRRQDGSDTVIIVVLGIFAGVVVGNWLAANLAALVGRRRTLGADLDESVTALKQLGDHLNDPRLAWPEPAASNLPGPILYWSSTAVVVLAAIGACALWLRFRTRRHEPVDRRRRVGVDAQPRLAKTRDLAPLLARQVEPGRLVVGHWKRRLVMTEAESYGSRRGVRGGVLLFGPSQSGKTTRLIESLNHWTGPAIISSVKTDLMRATIEHRSSVGEVKVFDPIGLTGRPASTWSPLHGADTLSGALTAAQLLARASGDDGPADRFWRGQAEQLLAAMLWVAANADGHTMRHVVRWVVEMDRPTDDDPGTLAPLVRLLTDHDDETTAADARQVQGWLHGQWGTDPRTSSSIYTTARNAVWPWTDPGLAASADGCDITLDWLTSGDNTLYLSAPLGDEGRLGVVFSVLLQDLIGQAFVRANRGGDARPTDGSSSSSTRPPTRRCRSCRSGRRRSPVPASSSSLSGNRRHSSTRRMARTPTTSSPTTAPNSSSRAASATSPRSTTSVRSSATNTSEVTSTNRTLRDPRTEERDAAPRPPSGCLRRTSSDRCRSATPCSSTASSHRRGSGPSEADPTTYGFQKAVPIASASAELSFSREMSRCTLDPRRTWPVTQVSSGPMNGRR